MKLLKNFKKNQTWTEEELSFHDVEGPANDLRLVYYVDTVNGLTYLGKFLFFKYTVAFQPNKELDGYHIPWHISDALNELILQYGWIRNEITDKWGMVNSNGN